MISQYERTFRERLASLRGSDRFRFLLDCACAAQSTEANRLGAAELLTNRTDTLARLEPLVNAQYPGTDEWVFDRLFDLCTALQAPFRPVLQLGTVAPRDTDEELALHRIRNIENVKREEMDMTEPLPETIEPWGPARAEAEFLARFAALTPAPAPVSP